MVLVMTLYVSGWNELGSLPTPKAQDLKRMAPFMPSFCLYLRLFLGTLQITENNLTEFK